MTTTQTIETLKADMDRAITQRRAELYTTRTTPAQHPAAYYGADGLLLPEVAAFRRALKALPIPTLINLWERLDAPENAS